MDSVFKGYFCLWDGWFETIISQFLLPRHCPVGLNKFQRHVLELLHGGREAGNVHTSKRKEPLNPCLQIKTVTFS